MSLAWRRHHVLIYRTWGSTPLAAIEDRVFFIGSVDDERESLSTLNASDGTAISEGPHLGRFGWPWKLAASEQYLFAADHFGTVVALDPDSGDLLWNTPLGFPHIATRFHTSDQFLFAESAHVLFVLDPQSGAILQGDLPAWAIAWSPASKTVISSTPRAFSTLTGDPMWESEVIAGTASPPLVTDQFLFLRGGDFQGKVYALDRNTGELLFASALPAVSNIARAGDSIYWLSSDAILYSWAPNQPLESPIAAFGEAPFDFECAPGGFFVAAAPGGSTIIVYTGDAGELTALDSTS